MDALFLIGAVAIGAKTKNWLAVAAGLFQLTAVLIAVVAIVKRASTLALASDIMYCVAIGFAIFVYLKGRSLSKDDDKREPCELMGAAGFIGLFGALLALTVLRP